MSLQDLGKLVKQKYPGSYDNVDDTKLGQQVYSKYPQYKSVVEQAQPSQPTQQSSGGVLESILRPIMNLMGATKAGGTGTPEETARLKESAKSTTKRQVGGAIETAALTTGAPEALEGVKGASILTNALKGVGRAAVTGTEYSVGKKTQGEKDSTAGDIASFAAIEGLFGSAKALAGGELGLSHWLTTQSELADVPRAQKIAKPGQMGGATVMGKMIDYGANSLNKAKEMAAKLTGGDGAVDKMVREAASNVEANVSGVMNVVKDQLGLDAVVKDVNKYGLTTAERKLYKDTLKAVTVKGGTLGDTKAGIDVFQSIKDMEKEATRLYKSDATRDVASKYRIVADELKDRLYKGLDQSGKKVTTGADDVLTSGIKEKYLPEIGSVSKKLAEEFKLVKTVGEARSLLAPFVRASQMFDSVAAAAEGGAKGMDIGKLLGGKKNLLGLVYQALGETGVKGAAAASSAAGKATEKAASSGVLKTIAKLTTGLLK